jgi:predicted Zn-dependent peptidase
VFHAVALSLLAGTALLAGVAVAEPLRLPPTRTLTLPNGVRLVLAEKRDVPMISFIAYLQGGSLADPEGKEGVASLTADMLRKGAGKRSARQIASEVDAAGAALSTGAVMEVTWISGEFLERDQGLMVDLLRNLLRNPTFPDSEFVKLKQQSIDALRSAKDDPNNLLTAYGTGYFFGSHPYGRPVDGDEASLARITREDVLAAYRANYGADRLILAMVGDFDPKHMEGVLKRALGDWPRAQTPRPAVAKPKRATGKHVLLVDKPDATQTYFWIGNLGISKYDPERDAVDVANTALGERYTSLLNTALRIKSGLTYGARSRFQRYAEPGAFAITSYAKTESTKRALDLALETLGHFRSTGLDAELLSSVRNYLTGLHPTNLETSDQIASSLAILVHADLPWTEVTAYTDRIAALDSAKVRAAIQRVYPPSEDLTMVLIGNAEQIRPVARQYGEVVEAKFDQPLIESVRKAARTP